MIRTTYWPAQWLETTKYKSTYCFLPWKKNLSWSIKWPAKELLENKWRKKSIKVCLLVLRFGHLKLTLLSIPQRSYQTFSPTLSCSLDIRSKERFKTKIGRIFVNPATSEKQKRSMNISDWDYGEHDYLG